MSDDLDYQTYPSDKPLVPALPGTVALTVRVSVEGEVLTQRQVVVAWREMLVVKDGVTVEWLVPATHAPFFPELRHDCEVCSSRTTVWHPDGQGSGVWEPVCWGETIAEVFPQQVEEIVAAVVEDRERALAGEEGDSYLNVVPFADGDGKGGLH